MKTTLISLLLIVSFHSISQDALKKNKFFFDNRYIDTTFFEYGDTLSIKPSMKFVDEFYFRGDYNSQINGFFFIDHFINMDFHGANFTRGANFEKTRFLLTMDFSDAIFNGQTRFWDNEIGDMVFGRIKCFSNLEFLGSKINQLVIDYSKIYGQLVLSTVRVENNLQLINLSIGYGLKMDRAVILKEFTISKTSIKEIWDMEGCTFYKMPNIIQVNLPETLNIKSLKFQLNQLSDLNQKLDFRLCKIDSLEIRRQGAKCNIKLEGTDLSKVLLPHNLFSLSFDESTTYEMKSGIYEAIIKTCKDAGMLESADGWDIEFQRFQNLHKYTFWGCSFLGSFINFLNDWWWGFGHEKWKILWIWLPLFFFIFVFYNCFRIEILYNKMYCDEELGSTFLRNIGRRKNHHNVYEPDFSKRKYRILYAIFYTAAIYFGFKLKHEAVNYMYTRGFLYLYLIYLFGAIHVAFGLSYILNIY